MLVLSRKVGERIHIGGEVFVEVRRVAGNRVTLAVCAPKDVRILRGELVNVPDTEHVLDEPVCIQSTTDTVIMHSPEMATENALVAEPACMLTE